MLILIRMWSNLAREHLAEDLRSGVKIPSLDDRVSNGSRLTQQPSILDLDPAVNIFYINHHHLMLSRLNTVRLSLSTLIPFFHSTQTPNRLASSMASAHTGPVESATFASGCFWGTEHIFLKKFPPQEGSGILKTRVGYTGGRDDMRNPDYKLVCTGATGHAEAVRIDFDPEKLMYRDLVEYFYRTHDPTQVDRQGPDTGTQYRSAIFYHTPEQRIIAEEVTKEIQANHIDKLGLKIVTTIEPAKDWYDAEDYHQEYLFKNPLGYHCPTHREHW